jgi:hypothetical protein
MKPGKGMGGVYQPTFKDRKTGEKKTLPTYWIYYNQRGKQVKERSNGTKEADAWKLLKKRHGEIAEGKPVGPDITRTTFEDMAAMLVNEYKANGRRSVNKLEDSINHLRAVFGQDKAVDITSDRITTYVTGWRVADEILTRQRHHLDLKAGWLRLKPGETKNNEGRMFPLTPMLREASERQVQKTEALQKAKGTIIPWLFHREGKRIKTFRRSWVSACIKAGLGKQVRDTSGKLVKKIAGRIPHDFRRTAVRNLERAGVPRSAAMKMVGHKTQSIYQRYAIADEGILKDATVKLQHLHEADEGKPPKNVQFEKK